MLFIDPMSLSAPWGDYSGINQEGTVIFTDDKCYVNDISLQTVATNSNWYSKHFDGLTQLALVPTCQIFLE